MRALVVIKHEATFAGGLSFLLARELPSSGRLAVSIRLRVAVITCAILASFATVSGQDSGTQYWYPVEPYRIEVDRTNPEVRGLLDQWERIGSELSQRNSNSFAGTYRKDAYRGWILRWSPGAGFVYFYHYEGLSLIDFSYGAVAVTPTEIQFIPEREMSLTLMGNKLRTPLVWIPAQTQHLRYMIPKTEFNDFGQYVAGLSHYNDFNGPCCEFDPFFAEPVSAVDVIRSDSVISVPDEYQQFIKRPITGYINFVGKRRIVKDYGLTGTLFQSRLGECSLRFIAINVGRFHGISKNMLLRVMGDQFNLAGQYIKVTSVRRRTAFAVLIRPVDDKGNETYVESDKRISLPLIRPGMRVTTSPIMNH